MAHHLWFVLDDGKITHGPDSEQAARTYYEVQRNAYKPEFQGRVLLLEATIQEPRSDTDLYTMDELKAMRYE